MGISARYNVSLNRELIKQLNVSAKELGISTSKFIRLAVIDKLRKMGKNVPDDIVYWGMRNDLSDRIPEAEKRKRKEKRGNGKHNVSRKP